MKGAYKGPFLTRHPHDDDEERHKADPEEGKVSALVFFGSSNGLLLKSKGVTEAILKRINMHALMVSNSLTFHHGAGWLSAAQSPFGTAFRPIALVNKATISKLHNDEECKAP